MKSVQQQGIRYSNVIIYDGIFGSENIKPLDQALKLMQIQARVF